MKINQIFDVYGGNGQYTEAYIEKNNGEYPLISGQTANNGVIGFIDSYDYDFGACLTYAKDGEKSGTIFKQSGKFSLTSHANALVLKKEYENKIDLDWFKFKYEPIFKSIITGRFGIPSLPQKILNTLSIKIIPKEKQIQELAEFNRKINATLSLKKCRTI